MRFRGKRRDGNEPAIIEALRAAGAFVEQLNGTGTPDLLVLYRGTLTLIEVKNPEQSDGNGYTKTGKLTEDQVKWWAAWGEPKPTIVYSADEALVAIGARS